MYRTRASAVPPAPVSPAVAAAVPVPIAAGVMRRRAASSLVVMDGDRVCGVLTERDLLRAASTEPRRAATLGAGDICSRRLADLMTADPLVVQPGIAVAVASWLMLRAGVGAAVTVDVTTAATGVVTATDLAVAAGVPGGGGPPVVGEVLVEVPPLSLDDDLERAVALVAAVHGRPLPVVHQGRPVGLVELCAAAPARLAGGDVLAVPQSSGVVGRRRGSSGRFYDRRQWRPPPHLV